MAKDDEHTPPRGSAKRNTSYSNLDDRALLERTADKAFQAYQTARRVEERMNEVLRPYARPWYERGAPAAIAVILFLIFIVFTMRTSSATVPEPNPRVQAVNK